ncbi:MAG: flavodoxin domain-containing protein [Bacteroidetes bacterium]|nr:flavodoxin domain-containing protein [Bacteroidota bacterium]
MALKITNNVDYVGQIDWTLRLFHGEQLSTKNGTTYNSYIVKGDKIALIDTVWQPFSDEFIADIEQTIGINNIDYMVILHGEPDHCYTLGNIMKLRPDLPIYCTANAVKSIKGYFHNENWDFNIVKTGDKLDLGNGSELTFIEIPMLHWPDQMMAYYEKDGVLFSSDPFGEHYCSEFMLSNKVDLSELEHEAIKYYANIVAPYSNIVKKKLAEVLALNLKIKMIAPSHGVIWTDPEYIINKYLQWCNSYKENLITIVFDTMYKSTHKIAKAIKEGIVAQDNEVRVKMFNSATTDVSDIVTEVFRSKAVLVGSPTYNSGILYSMAGLLDELRGTRLTNKKAAAFGSFGWSNNNIKILADTLKTDGFELFEPNGIAINWNPNKDNLKECRQFGREFAKWCK